MTDQDLRIAHFLLINYYLFITVFSGLSLFHLTVEGLSSFKLA